MGNPSQDGLAWAPYTESGQGTMVFDTKSAFRTLDDKVMVGLMSK